MTPRQQTARKAAIEFLSADELRMIMLDRRIDAVKLLRTRCGFGLSEAKKLVWAASGLFNAGGWCVYCHGSGVAPDDIVVVEGLLGISHEVAK